MSVGVMPERRRFTIEEYEKMVEIGILAQDDQVELIDGVTHLLVRGVGERARVQVQGPVRIAPRSKPQPDLALLRPRSYMREGAMTPDVLLVIEVADTSLPYDSTVKLRLYARAGISEYWIVDANAETLEVYRSPSGDRYVEHRHLARGETVTPLAFPDAVIPIDSIFA